MSTSFVLLCLGTFIVGYMLTMYLFHVKKKPFRGSQIQLKIHTWIPIFVVVAILAQQIALVNIAVIGALLGLIIKEFVRAKIAAHNMALSLGYLLCVLAGVVVLGLWAGQIPSFFVYLWYLSVLSDVGAYFLGNFFGKHPLPTAINPGKSWEGAAGQLIGALLGYALLQLFVPTPVGSLPGWLWIAVGVGSLIGDLTNSYIKRRGGFKDWSQSIPGHGGYLDRLSSLSFAALLAVVFSSL